MLVYSNICRIHVYVRSSTCIHMFKCICIYQINFLKISSYQVKNRAELSNKKKKIQKTVNANDNMPEFSFTNEETFFW